MTFVGLGVGVEQFNKALKDESSASLGSARVRAKVESLKGLSEAVLSLPEAIA